MIIKAPTSGLQRHPEGVFPAVLKSVSDERTESSTYNGKEKPRKVTDLTFETAHGTVKNKYTASLNKHSTLGQELRRWGKLTDEMAEQEFNLSNLVGQKADIVVLHNIYFREGEKEARIYVKIAGIFQAGSSNISVAA